jgi:hypothetical protein
MTDADAQENKKSVMIYIVETYGERFKSIETYGVVEQISRRYAQYHDSSATTATAAGDSAERYHVCFRSNPRQQPNGTDRWGPGIKEMDSVEEDYFNGDDEEVPAEPLPMELEPEKPLELKRRRSSDDEGDDELLHLAQKPSPRTKGIAGVTSLTLASEEPNGARSSSSPPPSSSPPSERPVREKRQRDTDEQEDEMDRLSRSSKRVVSPAEVKRKPSRGLNGGRKIAISLGKK